MITKAELLRLIVECGENITLKEMLDDVFRHLKYVCPKCKGIGSIKEKYDAYDKAAPDSSMVTDIRIREIDCDLCRGQGYTEEKYIADTEIITKGYKIDKS